jgi:2-oxoisovalerate dehydrogenase E1 component
VKDYDWLPDGFALRAEIKAREGAHDVAAIFCQRAIALGLPVFKDGLGVLVSRVRQYLRANLMKPSRKGISEAFENMLEMAPCVDWGSLVTTIHGWKFPSAERKETELDWMALDKLGYTDQALPETFLFPPATYSARLQYSERRPKPQQKYHNLQREELIQAYRLMLTSRRLDDREIQLKRQNRVFFSISCAGHEAIQTAAALALQPGKDWVFTYYRDRALCLGLGIRPYEMLLHALGSAADTSGGRQITNSFTAPHLHIISNPGAVGTSFAQAVGCAHAARLLNSSSDEITVVSSGEGATNEGQFWEALNAACLDALPVLFLVQDNGFAASIPVSQQLAGGNISDLVRSFPKLLIKEVDGTELTASWEAMGEAVAWCRERRGPALVHAHVVRLYSHSFSDDERMYKTQAQRTAEASRDPIANFGNWLTSQGFITESDLRKLEHDVNSEIQLATERALTEPEADRSQNDHHLYSEVLSPTDNEAPAQPQPGATPVTLVDSINRTLADEMARDKRIIVFGEDVADLADETQLGKLKGKGGMFKVTYGLQKQFGSARCFNTPVAESAIVGRAIGMAIRGLKPVAEIQFMDYVWGAMLQIRNELAPMRWRSFNSYHCPVVIRIPTGGYLNGGGSFHSQSGEVAFAHIPGLRVVMPSTALDAAGLLRTALRCDDPVIFLEPKRLYRESFNRGPYPGPDFTIPFGRANVVKPGSSLTIITYGALVQRSLQAAQRIERERPGLTIEVIDLRSLAPYDWNTIVESVTKTSRVLIAYEDWKSWGYGAELAARIGREMFKELDAPVGRVAAADRWIGYHPGLEDDTLPQPDDVIAEAKKIIDY